MGVRERKPVIRKVCGKTNQRLKSGKCGREREARRSKEVMRRLGIHICINRM
jgi:hypothetical protein